jgi:hypothetical protein
MTEEVVLQEGAEQTQEVEYTPTQLKALEQGWKPKDEFEGPEDEFIDAPEFVRRGELFSKIESQSKELKAVRRALEDFRANQSKSREQEVDRAIKNLKQERRAAVIDGDAERAFELEDEIDSISAEKTKIAQESARPAVQEVNPEFAEWQNTNAWYEKDNVMRAAADAIGFDLARSGMSPSQVLKEVAKEIRKEFPHKFTNPKGARASAVESSTRTGNARSENVELSDVERTIMNRLVSRGDMTEAEYKKQIKASRGA